MQQQGLAKNESASSVASTSSLILFGAAAAKEPAAPVEYFIGMVTREALEALVNEVPCDVLVDLRPIAKVWKMAQRSLKFLV